MGFFGAIGNALKGAVSGVVNAVPSAVRGLGRLARGKWREGLGDIGGAMSGASSVLHLLPGVGTTAAAGIGGAGQLLSSLTRPEGMLQAGDMGYIPDDQLVVPISGGLTNPRGPGAAMQGGGQSTLGKIGGFLKSPGGLAALAGLAGILDARSKRKAQQRMDQQKLDMLMAALTKSEKRQDMMDPAYGQSLANILGSLQDPGFLNQQLR